MKKLVLAVLVAVLIVSSVAFARTTTTPVTIPGDQVAEIIVDGVSRQLSKSETVTVPVGRDLVIIPRHPIQAPKPDFGTANGKSPEENLQAIRDRAVTGKKGNEQRPVKSADTPVNVPKTVAPTASTPAPAETTDDGEWVIPVARRDSHWTTVGKIDVKNLKKYFKVIRKLEKRGNGYYGFVIKNTSPHRLQLIISGDGFKCVHWDNHGHAESMSGERSKCEPGAEMTLWFWNPVKSPW